MRTLCTVAIVVCSIAAASEARAEAVNYEPIRFDAGMAGSYVDASSRSGGGFVSEIKYLVHDHVGIGGRIDFEMMFGGRVADDVDLDFGMAGAALAKAEYYVGDGPIRPWAGGGIGAYSISSLTFTNANREGTQGKYFGIAPQIGIDLGRVRFAATYNMVFGAGIDVTRTINGVDQKSTYSQNYLTLELSFRVGGERKYKPAPFTPMAPYPSPPPSYPPAPYPPPPPPP